MIIGLTGSFGAGKGAVAEYLVEEKGFAHYSARDFITKEIQKRNMPVTREAMIKVANDLRAQFGPGYIISELFKEAQKHGGDAVVESLRAVAEVETLKELGGVVIGIDAEPELRYKRMTSRGTETDHVSFERWKEQQEEETNENDPTKQNIFGALKASDNVIQNNGTLEELHKNVDEALNRLVV
jgi:dephospho-CoA kinase